MIELQDIFEIRYGNQFDLNKMDRAKDDIHFVGRSAKNNGVTAVVGKYKNVTPFNAGLITVALGGSVLSSFLQVRPFYTGQNIAVLSPKKELSTAQKLFYCKAIQNNAFRFSTCGREANRSLKFLSVPAIDEIPDWVNTYDLKCFLDAKNQYSKTITDLPPTSSWKEFKFSEIFEIKKGKRLTKANINKGSTRFIGAIDSNNGLREHIDKQAIHPENTITVNYNGNGVAEAFYQDKPYWCSDDVNALYPKFKMNQFVALFICTVIRKEKYRFSYGRKWHMERMNRSTIRLPVDNLGNLDTTIMENFIKSLPFSHNI